MTVAEPQGESDDNSWHLHILLIFDVSAPYIENNVIAELWGNGITDSNKVYDADGLALYFKAYLSDVEYESDENEEDTSNYPSIVGKNLDGKDKKFIKGECLKYYPTSMPLFSASRGMKRPMVEKISNKEAMERVVDCKLAYRETYAIGNDNKGNIID